MMKVLSELHVNRVKEAAKDVRPPTWMALSCLVMLAVASPATAQLVATPDTIVFDRKDVSVDVEISFNGEPMDGAALVDHELFVNDNTYREMLEVTGRPGGVTIRPTDLLEIGSYQLELDTAHGYLRLPLYSPLTAMDSSLESRAAGLGISIEELKERLGQTTRLERGGIQLNVSPVYYVGQQLHIPLAAEPDRSYQWFVNDMPVSEAQSNAELKYVFETAGDYFFLMRETNAEGVTTAEVSALVHGTVVPPVQVEIIPNRNLILRGPNQYQVHTWTLDGQPAGSGLEWTHTFSTPGRHEVEVVSRRPDSGLLGDFHVQRYVVTVATP